MKLRSDPKGRWEPVVVHVMARVTLDEREDLAWVECHPPVAIGGRTHQLVLLQPRYLADSLWDVGDGVPVYVCVTNAPEDETSERLTRSQVKVLDWGEVRAD